MSNLTDFIGGGGGYFSREQVGKSSEWKSLTDGTNALHKPYNAFENARQVLGDGVNDFACKHKDNGRKLLVSALSNGEIFDYFYSSSEKMIIEKGSTLTSVEYEYYGVHANELVVEGVIETSNRGNGSATFASSGKGGYQGTLGAIGTNPMSGVWDFMPKGGQGGRNSNNGSSPAGGVGYSSGGSCHLNSGFYGGSGGGLLFVIANNISGLGTLRAKGGDREWGGDGGGGGGIVIVITDEWSGTVAIDVSGGSSITTAQEGSYCILKPNPDGTLTLMVHSENGVSADLNGQTPVHGADASIAW